MFNMFNPALPSATATRGCALRCSTLLSAGMLAFAFLAGSAHARTIDFASAGSWDTFGGTDDAGNEVCGMSTYWNDGRSLMIKRYSGDNYLTIQLVNPAWRIAGDGYAMSLTFDDNSPWTGKASAMQGSSGLEFTVPKLRITDFISEFTASNSLAVEMGSNAVSWQVGLAGTENVTNEFRKCIDDMDN